MNPIQTVTVRRIFISPGHNYFGRHGQAAGRHPISEVSEVECVAGRGLRGDRFWDFKADYKGQITFFSWETLLQLWTDLQVPEDQRDASAPRRNVLIEGADMPFLVGREFLLQGIRFLGTEECRPCYWMNGAIEVRAEQWMRGRGGLRAKILTSGVLRTGIRSELTDISPLDNSLIGTGHDLLKLHEVQSPLSHGLP